MPGDQDHIEYWQQRPTPQSTDVDLLEQQTPLTDSYYQFKSIRLGENLCKSLEIRLNQAAARIRQLEQRLQSSENDRGNLHAEMYSDKEALIAIRTKLSQTEKAGEELAESYKEVCEFIHYITLRLQSHRALNDTAKDGDFKQAYVLYQSHNVKDDNLKKSTALTAWQNREK